MGSELRRLDDESAGKAILADLRKIPAFHDLPQEERAKLIRVHAENMVEAIKLHGERQSESLTAENDLNVLIDVVNRLDQQRKMYAVKQDFKTGSGRGTVSIKGGDVRFIVPILVAIGVVIVAAILLLRR